MGVKAKYEYVVYKGDEILSAGTANEIIRRWVSQKRIKEHEAEQIEQTHDCRY